VIRQVADFYLQDFVTISLSGEVQNKKPGEHSEGLLAMKSSTIRVGKYDVLIIGSVLTD